jgi:hypothetical protein
MYSVESQWDAVFKLMTRAMTERARDWSRRGRRLTLLSFMGSEAMASRPLTESYQCLNQMLDLSEQDRLRCVVK